jgi:hypothetical protein
MASLLPILVLTMLAVGLLLVMVLPAEFRNALFRPATLGQRLLVRSLGIVAVVTLIAHFFNTPCTDKCGSGGCSPCLYFGIYASLVLYGQASWYLWKRHAKDQAMPPDAASAP